MARVALFVPVLLLIGGCRQKDGPLRSELKGRWTDASAARPGAPCRSDYLTFDTGEIMAHSAGRDERIFVVRTARRDGTRVILTGGAPDLPAVVDIEIS